MCLCFVPREQYHYDPVILLIKIRWISYFFKHFIDLEVRTILTVKVHGSIENQQRYLQSIFSELLISAADTRNDIVV